MTYGFGLAGEGVQAFGEGVRQARQEKLDTENLHIERLYKRYELAKDAKNRAQEKAAWRYLQRVQTGSPHGPEDDQAEAEYQMAEQYENSILDEMSNVLGGGGKKAQAKGTKAFLQKLFGLQEEYDRTLPPGPGKKGAPSAQPQMPQGPAQGTMTPAAPTLPPSQQRPAPGQRFQLPAAESIALQGREPTAAIPTIRQPEAQAAAVASQTLALPHAPRPVGREGDVTQLKHYEPALTRMETEGVPRAETAPAAAATAATPTAPMAPTGRYSWGGGKAESDVSKVQRLTRQGGVIPSSVPMTPDTMKRAGQYQEEEVQRHVGTIMENLSGYVQHVLSTPDKGDDSLAAAKADPVFAKHINLLEELQAKKIIPATTVDTFLRRHWPQEYSGRGAARGPSASEEQWAAFKVPPEQRTPEQKRIIEAAKEQKSLGSLAGSVPREQWDAFKTPPERRTPEQKAIIEGYKEQRKIAGPGISIITGVDPDTLEETIFAVTRTQPPTATPVQGIKPRPGAIPQSEIEEEREISTPDPRFPGTDLRTTKKVRVASARKIIQYYERNKSKISVRTLANMARPEIFRDNPEDLQVLRDYIRNMHKKSGATEFPNETEIDLEAGPQPESGSRFAVPPRTFGR